MKNNTKLKGITIIRVDAIELDSQAKVSEVLSSHEAGTKVFGFLSTIAVKAIKALAPKVGLQVVDSETKVEPKTEAKAEAKPEAEPEAKPESKFKAKAAFNPQKFDYSEIFNSDSDKKRKKEKNNSDDVSDALEELRKFKNELRRKYKL